MAEQTYALSQSGVYGLANGAYADALSAIPDSDIHQYRMEEGSGTSLSDSRGSVPATLFGGGWTTSSRSFFDHATVYDGTDDYWLADSPLAVNGQTYSAWVWINRSGAGTVFPRVVATNNDPSNNFSDGWEFCIRDDPGNVRPGELVVRHADAGSRNFIYESGGGVIPSGEDIFIGLSGNGDSASVYVWDTSAQIDSGSGTASRGQTADTSVIGMATNGQYLSGDVSAVGFSDQEYTEQDFADIWSATV